MPSRKSANSLLFIRDDMRLSTWILWGAVLQSLLTVTLPRYVSVVPAILLLSGRIIYTAMQGQGLLQSDSMDGVMVGKRSFQIPNRDGTFPSKPAAQDVCVFILSARSNHAKGRWGPGMLEINDYFRDMWVEASRNRESWGYLGKTPTLSALESEHSNTMVWISYWRSIDGLQRFAQSDVHRKGWNWYNKGQPKNSHIAIQHEAYLAPAGHWQNIAFNFKPFGFSATKHAVQDASSEVKLVSPLQPSLDAKWKTMKGRMGM